MGTKKIKLSNGRFTLIDQEDFDWLNEFKWHINSSNQNTLKKIYVKTAIKENGKFKTIYLHRLLMKFPIGMQVDHINGNTLDNRKTNLRVCTKQQNNFNMRLNSTNTSGYKGVSWFKPLNKWQVGIYLNNKRIHLGFFVDIKEAAEVYNEAAKKYFREFACLNRI